ncbi:MAG: ATP phosphoribosyltransferase regulatory subunit, partial [Lachnospiraceae bacterium]|nr:ATP phosphoribosyltransferase regulatory subunit [Lachnospiraceae bacterium]
DKETLLKVSGLFGSVDILQEAKKAVSNMRSLAAIERLESLYRVLTDYGVEKYVSFDLGMLSKYNYYTGIIFKGYTYGVGDAIVKGGRYDQLLPHFGKEAAAIGFVIVVDDLLAAMGRQNVVVSGLEEPLKLHYTESDFNEKRKEAKRLRAAGKKVEFLPQTGKEGVPENE